MANEEVDLQARLPPLVRARSGHALGGRTVCPALTCCWSLLSAQLARWQGGGELIGACCMPGAGVGGTYCPAHNPTSSSCSCRGLAPHHPLAASCCHLVPVGRDASDVWVPLTASFKLMETKYGAPTERSNLAEFYGLPTEPVEVVRRLRVRRSMDYALFWHAPPHSHPLPPPACALPSPRSACAVCIRQPPRPRVAKNPKALSHPSPLPTLLLVQLCAAHLAFARSCNPRRLVGRSGKTKGYAWSASAAMSIEELNGDARAYDRFSLACGCMST